MVVLQPEFAVKAAPIFESLKSKWTISCPIIKLFVIFSQLRHKKAHLQNHPAEGKSKRERPSQGSRRARLRSIMHNNPVFSITAVSSGPSDVQHDAYPALVPAQQDHLTVTHAGYPQVGASCLDLPYLHKSDDRCRRSSTCLRFLFCHERAARALFKLINPSRVLEAFLGPGRSPSPFTLRTRDNSATPGLVLLAAQQRIPILRSIRYVRSRTTKGHSRNLHLTSGIPTQSNIVMRPKGLQIAVAISEAVDFGPLPTAEDPAIPPAPLLQPSGKLQPWRAARRSMPVSNVDGGVQYTNFTKDEMLLLEGHSG